MPGMDAMGDENVAVEITRLEGELKSINSSSGGGDGAAAVATLTRLAALNLQLDKKAKCATCLESATVQFLTHPTSAKDGLLIVDCAHKYWKSLRYLNKDMRLNMSAERSKVFTDAFRVLDVCKQKQLKDTASVAHVISLKMAFHMECSGAIQESLAALSDLISAQATDGVDLSYIIFKAAVLVKHLNGHNQAIEYLEYVLDEPPENDGYGKTHILAFLAMVYDQHPEKNDYVVVLGKTYDDLMAAYSADMAAGKRPLTNQIKIEEMLAKKSVGKTSEIWEMLALQSIDRCEYLLAFEFMQQAVLKTPNKPKLLHTIAEVAYYLGIKDKALDWAERAFALQPQSADLRNLLLALNPAKWQDKLRNVATSVTLSKIKATEDKEIVNVKLKKTGDDDDDDGGLLGALKEGANVLFSAGGSMSPEQKALKEEKAKRKKEKQDKLERKAQKEKQKQAAASAAIANIGIKPVKKVGAKRNPEIDGPAKPPKPFITRETIRIFNLVRDGNKKMHLYDPILIKYQQIRERVELESTQKGIKRW